MPPFQSTIQEPVHNQKYAVRFKRSRSLTCPLTLPDSAQHTLFVCFDTQKRNLSVERHNLACSMIKKAIGETNSLESCFVSMNTGSSEWLAMQNIQILKQLKVGLYLNGSFHPAFQTNRFYLQTYTCCTGRSYPKPKSN